MLRIEKDKKDIEKDLDFFIWKFKIKDNILYNMGVLNSLIDDYNDLNKDYKKPISIIAVSIIEAIMIDLLYRLYKSTKHFPDSLKHQEEDIKNRLQKETKKSKYIDLNGQEWCFPTLKNFNFTLMINIYEEFKLLGENEEIYKSLLNLAYFRNRIHINNYFNKFEKDEDMTFSEARVQKTLNIMIWFFEHFKRNYMRPWPKLIN